MRSANALYVFSVRSLMRDGFIIRSAKQLQKIRLTADSRSSYNDRTDFLALAPSAQATGWQGRNSFYSTRG
jgi:hypothetical protein